MARGAYDVACWVRNAGVWKRTLPQAKASSAWKDNQLFHARASGTWEVAFADLIRALNQHATVTINSFDFSVPYSVGVGYRFNIDGSTDFRDQPGTPTFVQTNTPWLNYETTYWTYDVFFSDNDTHNLDVVPTLGGTRIPMTGLTQEFNTDRTAIGTEDGRFTVSFVDNAEGAPAPVHMTFQLLLSASAEGLE